MANMRDFQKAYNVLIAADGFDKDRSLKMERESWRSTIQYTAYIAGNTEKKGSISFGFLTPMEAVEDVIKQAKEAYSEPNPS